MAERKPDAVDADGPFVVCIELFNTRESVPVFDIQVEQDESFIVAGVVVHNSALCRARDGKIYPVDSGPRPPAHVACRSSTAPVTKSWKELGLNLNEAPPGTRASMNGQVPDDLVYSSWLRKQPVEFQEEVLGKTKATLFRKGEIDLDRFVDRAGNELTLAELRRKEAEAWERAGLSTASG